MDSEEDVEERGSGASIRQLQEWALKAGWTSFGGLVGGFVLLVIGAVFQTIQGQVAFLGGILIVGLSPAAALVDMVLLLRLRLLGVRNLLTSRAFILGLSGAAVSTLISVMMLMSKFGN